MNTKTLEVKVKDSKYKIVIGSDIIPKIGTLIKKQSLNKKMFIVTNKRIGNLYLKKVEESFKKQKIKIKSIFINDGEKYKTIDTINFICLKLLEYKIERNDTLVALGGGVIGDMVGFAASITLRGINFIQIPTTLLSQVDSAVGGKTGINTKFGKNMIGSFYQPKLVVIDVSFLRTLTRREILSGYSEIIKYGLILNQRFFNWLLKNEMKLLKFDSAYLIYAIYMSCRSKAIIVNKDEKEKSVRALLNFGHTFGHALEVLNNYKSSLNHGESVSIGIMMAMEMSFLEGNISYKEVEKVRFHFEKLGIRHTIPNSLKTNISLKKFKKIMSSDKKVKNNKINLILIRRTGEAYITNNFSNGNLSTVIKKFIN